ncbi:MAG: flagellar biosynthetic protein FliR [Candidatus Scalinduaceae bacterium]
MLLNIINLFPLFIIVLFRTAGVLFFSPIFNQTSLPLIVKVGLALAITIAIFPAVNSSQQTLPDSMLAFIFIIFKEIAIGFIIGYAATLVFEAFVFAGDLISAEMGLQMAVMADPLSENQITVVSQLIQVIGFLVFLAINGHHWIINALVLSYKTVPITEFFGSGITISKTMQMFEGLFISAIKIAAPVMIIMSLIVIVTGLIGRSIPQINILMTVFPLKIIVGSLILAIIFPFIVRAMEYLLNIFRKDLFSLVGGM